MTYIEIKSTIESNSNIQLKDLKFKAKMIHQLGSLIGLAVNEPKKSPKLKDTFPGLFKEEVPEKQQDWQIMKDRVSQYNAYLKKKRGEKI